MNLKQIDGQIKRVRTNGVKYNDLVQTVAVAIIRHAEEHGDCSRALKLVQALPMSNRRTLLVKFFATYAPIGMNVAKGLCRINKGDKAARFNVAGAEANPWHVVAEKDEEEIPDTTLADVRDMFERLGKKVAKLLEEGKVAANDVEPIRARVKALNELANVA